MSSDRRGMKDILFDFEARASWLALHLVPGVGEVTLRRLVDHFGTPEAVWGASSEEFSGLPWLRPSVRRALVRGPDIAAVSRARKALESCGGWMMTFHDDCYPSLLSSVSDPPPVLYGIGDPAALEGELVALVGSRQASTYGIKVAKELSMSLASYNIGVVSGLAIGVDTAAHKGALSGGGITVGVKGCGIDVPYPRRNVSLAVRIAGRGAVVSEFPPGVLPEAGHFPARNRIISGLSRGVVVVEASPKSGSLITASCALDQGRDVMAVPGSIFSFKSRGTHYLIKMGARLVEGVQDILDELGMVWDEACPVAGAAGARGRATSSLPEEQKVLARLEAYPQHVDEIAEACGMPVSRVSGLLLQLELKDLVMSLPGQMYQLK